MAGGQNVEARARNSFAAAGLVCQDRPHLAERVLHLPIEYLVQAGAIRAELAFTFTSQELARPRPDFAAAAGPEGLHWLSDELPLLSKQVEKLVARAMQ